MTTPIDEFLLRPENLETALQLMEHVERVRLQIFQEFWDGVRQDLDARLRDAGLDDKWMTAYFHPSIRDRYSTLAIYWRAGWEADERDNHSRPYVGAEGMTGNPGPCVLVVHRGVGEGVGPEKQDPIDQELGQRLQNRGLKGTKWSIGMRQFIRDGLPSFALTDTAVVMSLLSDRAAGKIRSDVVKLIWDVFQESQGALEELAKKDPYRTAH